MYGFSGAIDPLQSPQRAFGGNRNHHVMDTVPELPEPRRPRSFIIFQITRLAIAAQKQSIPQKES